LAEGGQQKANRTGLPARFARTCLLRIGRGSVNFKISGYEAKASSGNCASLAGHGLRKTLTLQSGRQVHLTAGEQASEKLHCNLHSVAKTGRLRLMEWGSSFVAVHISMFVCKLNRKSEALGRKCDIGLRAVGVVFL